MLFGFGFGLEIVDADGDEGENYVPADLRNLIVEAADAAAGAKHVAPDVLTMGAIIFLF